MHENTPPATYNLNKRIEVREDSVEQKKKIIVKQVNVKILHICLFLDPIYI